MTENPTTNVKNVPTVQPAGVIHELLHAQKRFRVITSNEEILHRSGEQLVQACQLSISAEVWVDNFKRMEKHVKKWTEERAAQVAAVLVELRKNKVVFLFIPMAEEYDFELGFALADLDTYLTTQGGIGYCETRQIPYWDIPTFAPTTSQVSWVNEVIAKAAKAEKK